MDLSKTASAGVEAEGKVRALVDAGQWFLAYDAAQRALARGDETPKVRQLAARALIRLGAPEEAKRVLEPLCKGADLGDAHLHQFHERLRSAAKWIRLDGPASELPAESLTSLADLLRTLASGVDVSRQGREFDEESLGLLARAFKETWKESGSLEDARQARDAYARAFGLTGGHWTCINAAAMSWILSRLTAGAGDAAGAAKYVGQAQRLARQALELCEKLLATVAGEDRFWALATTGDALLLLGEADRAVAAYDAASQLSRRHSQVVSTTEQLRLLEQYGLAVPARVYELFRPPGVVMFTGLMIDGAGRRPPRFVAEMEGAVRAEIDRALDEVDARVGFCSAACGSDLLFIEAMQERDAEVNILLPFDRDDFVRTSVAHAGEAWVRRFNRAMKIAGDSVRYTTREKHLGTTGLYSFNGQILQGSAALRARSMGTQPYLVAVWDRNSPRLEGGTADLVARWPDKGRVRTIDVADLARPSVPPTDVVAAPVSGGEEDEAAAQPGEARRVIRTLLFADVVGFSLLQEEHVPYFMYKFLDEISRYLKELAVQPVMVNTWGDAIFAVMERAIPMARYAQALQRVVLETDWEKLGLPPRMSVRIGLHAGPVYGGDDPITGKPNYFGSHVNRAARLEPVTVPGHVYATEQFVGMLASEEQSTAEPAGGWPFVCEYLGTLSLAKNAGGVPVYHMRRRGRQREEGRENEDGR